MRGRAARPRAQAAPEDLQDDDLLEMLNAGLVGLAVVDRYKATTWARVFKRIKPRDDLKVHEGGDIAWMIRKDSPRLKPRSRRSPRSAGGAALGNSLVKKYTGSTRFVRAATSKEMRKKFDQTVELSASTAAATTWTTPDDGAGLPGVASRPEHEARSAQSA